MNFTLSAQYNVRVPELFNFLNFFIWAPLSGQLFLLLNLKCPFHLLLNWQATETLQNPAADLLNKVWSCWSLGGGFASTNICLHFFAVCKLGNFFKVINFLLATLAILDRHSCCFLLKEILLIVSYCKLGMENLILKRVCPVLPITAKIIHDRGLEQLAGITKIFLGRNSFSRLWRGAKSSGLGGSGGGMQ